MSFPVYIPIGPWRVHPHLLFESLSYFIGFRVYLALRRRAGDTVIVPMRWATLSCAAAGAALGARGLAWLANPAATWDAQSVLLGGKTIVGGLIGGLIAYLAFNGYETATMNFQSFSQIAFAFRVTPALLATAMIYALVMGLFGGMLPAIRAARLPVVTALREL